MIKMCEGRSIKAPGPCRPDLWSDDSKGFLQTIVLQCVFCKTQVQYSQLVEIELEDPNVDSSVALNSGGNGSVLY